MSSVMLVPVLFAVLFLLQPSAATATAVGICEGKIGRPKTARNTGPYFSISVTCSDHSVMAEINWGGNGYWGFNSLKMDMFCTDILTGKLVEHESWERTQSVSNSMTFHHTVLRGGLICEFSSCAFDDIVDEYYYNRDTDKCRIEFEPNPTVSSDAVSSFLSRTETLKSSIVAFDDDAVPLSVLSTSTIPVNTITTVVGAITTVVGATLIPSPVLNNSEDTIDIIIGVVLGMALVLIIGSVIVFLAIMFCLSFPRSSHKKTVRNGGRTLVDGMGKIGKGKDYINICKLDNISMSGSLMTIEQSLEIAASSTIAPVVLTVVDATETTNHSVKHFPILTTTVQPAANDNLIRKSSVSVETTQLHHRDTGNTIATPTVPAVAMKQHTIHKPSMVLSATNPIFSNSTPSQPPTAIDSNKFSTGYVSSDQPSGFSQHITTNQHASLHSTPTTSAAGAGCVPSNQPNVSSNQAASHTSSNTSTSGYIYSDQSNISHNQPASHPSTSTSGYVYTDQSNISQPQWKQPASHPSTSTSGYIYTDESNISQPQCNQPASHPSVSTSGYVSTDESNISQPQRNQPTLHPLTSTSGYIYTDQPIPSQQFSSADANTAGYIYSDQHAPSSDQPTSSSSLTNTTVQSGYIYSDHTAISNQPEALSANCISGYIYSNELPVTDMGTSVSRYVFSDSSTSLHLDTVTSHDSIRSSDSISDTSFHFATDNIYDTATISSTQSSETIGCVDQIIDHSTNATKSTIVNAGGTTSDYIASDCAYSLQQQGRQQLFPADTNGYIKQSNGSLVTWFGIVDDDSTIAEKFDLNNLSSSQHCTLDAYGTLGSSKACGQYLDSAGTMAGYIVSIPMENGTNYDTDKRTCGHYVY